MTLAIKSLGLIEVICDNPFYVAIQGLTLDFDIIVRY